MANKLSPERAQQRQKNIETARATFNALGGEVIDGFTVIDAEVFHTSDGVPYLKKPGVALIAKPQVNIKVMKGFLEGYDPEYQFDDYLNDEEDLEPGAQLVKAAGQVCYASFGPKRTLNIDADAYIEDLKQQEHGSVLEHPSWTFLLYGISRSISHEEVRHRAGKGFSQLSQRYVSDRVLRFVERPEYQSVPSLHQRFEKRIGYFTTEYEEVGSELMGLQLRGDSVILSADAKTDLRKKVQQAARSVLPNETETVMVDTGNARAFQHTINMRSSSHAETEIREMYFREYLCLMMVEPLLFGDFEIRNYPDGTRGAQSIYKKP